MKTKHMTACYGSRGAFLAAYDQNSFDLVGQRTTATFNYLTNKDGGLDTDGERQFIDYITSTCSRDVEMFDIHGLHLIDVCDLTNNEKCAVAIAKDCMKTLPETVFHNNTFGEIYFVLAYCGAIHAFLHKENTDAVYTDIQRVLRWLPPDTISRITPHIETINQRCEEILSPEFGAYPTLFMTAGGSFRVMTALVITNRKNVSR